MLRYINFVIFVFIIFLSLAATPSFAQTSDNESIADYFNRQKNIEEGESPNKPSLDVDDEESNERLTNQFGFFDFFNVIFALFLVIMLLLVSLRFIKKKNQAYGITKHMMNIGGTSLGGNRSVQLVKIGDRILVVGVGENIQLLKEIDSKEEVEQLLKEQQGDFQQLPRPSDLIGKLFKKEEPEKQSEFKNLLKNELSVLSSDRKKLLNDLNSKGNKHNE